MGFRDVSLNELPCGTPIIMMTVRGEILQVQGAYVKLIASEDNTVTIQRADDDWQQLICTDGYYYFGHPAEALKFKPRMSPGGRLTFELEATTCALTLNNEKGSRYRLTCKEKYWKDEQAWVLLQQCRLGPSEVVSDTLRKMNEAAARGDEGRCELIIHLVKAGKSTEDLKNFVKLLYEDKWPSKSAASATKMSAKHRQHAVTLLMAGKSAKEVEDIMGLMS